MPTVPRSLRFRLLLSYLVVVGIGGVTIVATARLYTPRALIRHAERMSVEMGDGVDLTDDVNRSFAAAVDEILMASITAAVIAAVAVSVSNARRILGQVRSLAQASRRIASGEYDQRVEVPGDDEFSHLAASFNRMAERLEITEERRMALIGDVAHELRTPVASIRGLTEGLVDGVLDPRTETYAQIQREVARMEAFIRDLAELSRVEAGAIVVEPRPISVMTVIEQVSSRLAFQFEGKGVNLRLVPAADLPTVSADPARVAQIVTNLVGNALQYTEAGGSVTVSARHDGHEVRVDVSDTGIGLAPDSLERVFERFYRVERSRSRAGGGTGIGLAVARHLVQAHHGRIWAESPGLGRGSTFSFTLPIEG